MVYNNGKCSTNNIQTFLHMTCQFQIWHPLHSVSLTSLFQVAKLFQKIQEMVEEENNLVFVLIGEIYFSFVLFLLALLVHVFNLWLVSFKIMLCGCVNLHRFILTYRCIWWYDSFDCSKFMLICQFYPLFTATFSNL